MSLSDLQPLFDDVDSISSDARSIYQNTRYLQGTLDTLNQTQTTQSDYQRKILLSLTGQVDGYPPIGYTPISTILQEIASNTRNAGDALAGNPWWATNSAFTVVRSQRSSARPSEQPDGTYTYSFPQFMSYWSSALALPYTSVGTSYSHAEVKEKWFDWLGVNRLPVRTYYSASEPYTWFDWMTDAMRSNLVSQGSLLGSTAAPSEEDTAATSAVDDGDTSGTNAVPEMVVERMNVTGVEDALELVDADAVGDMLPSSFTDANPEFVVFSGGRYGAVTVPEVRASLAIPENVARYLRGVATWLWRVALFVGCFFIVRQEVAFWSTLGGSASDA